MSAGPGLQSRFVRIVHVLSYVSVGGDYGGPVAVARAQTHELALRGHDVTLVAGWDGLAELTIPGVHVRLFKVHRIPGLGFAGHFSAAMVRVVRELARTADIVHLHCARDLVQLGSALTSRSAASVLQSHGMIRSDSRPLARVIDAVATRRVLVGARGHLVLVAGERADIADVSRGKVSPDQVFAIRNGVPPSQLRARWSETDPTVVFVSRLHRRKRPVTFVEMAAVLLSRGHRVRFDLYGSDEGERGAVEDAIRSRGLSDRVTWRGPLEPQSVLGVMSQSQVFVLPSVDEPFPMAVLEALSTGLPCVITDKTGISDELQRARAAIVTDGSTEQLAAAVERLLSSRHEWEEASAAGRRAADEAFGTQAMVDALERVYHQVGDERIQELQPTRLRAGGSPRPPGPFIPEQKRRVESTREP